MSAIFITKFLNKEDLFPGQLIDVGGFRMHIHCMGPENSLPTVIIEGGLGCPTSVYYWIQEKLSKSVRTITYDRAGLGWSEESNQPHDAEHMVTHLHTLLEKVGIKGPYVLVGHSLAGLIMRVYAGKYPEDVAGMAFLDASHPRHNEMVEISNVLKRNRSLFKYMKLVSSLRLSHIYNPVIRDKNFELEYLPQIQKRQVEDFFCKSQTYETCIAESVNFSKSAKQALQVDNLVNIPAVAITASDRGELSDGSEGVQPEDCSSFSRSWHKVIEGATHMSLITNKKFADQAVDEILELIFRLSECLNWQN